VVDLLRLSAQKLKNTEITLRIRVDFAHFNRNSLNFRSFVLIPAYSFIMGRRFTADLIAIYSICMDSTIKFDSYIFLFCLDVTCQMTTDVYLPKSQVILRSEYRTYVHCPDFPLPTTAHSRFTQIPWFMHWLNVQRFTVHWLNVLVYH